MSGVTKPTVNRVDLPRLVDMAREGRIRIPEFQRSYRWEYSDAVRLFDSIFRGFPIGNLLMWRKPAPAAEIGLGALQLTVPQRADALWVVDGQQRLTTLIGALTATEETGDRRFRIYFDLKDAAFVSATPARRIPDHWLPVWVAGDNRKLLAWQRERPWLTDPDFDLCDALATALRTYEIPVYEIEGDDEQVLTEIFDRMNTFGRSLKRSEIFRALHSAPTGPDPSDPDALRARVVGLGFGEFSDQMLMQSVLAIRDGKVDRDFRGEFKSDEDRYQAFARAEQALRLVVEFLREQAGIPHIRLLPYALFVPVLARFCALFGRPEGRSAELLRRWIWRGSLGGAAPQGNTVAVRRNAGAVESDPVASAGRLLALLPPGGETWEPDLTQTGLNRAQAKVNVLGLLSAKPRLLADLEDSDGNRYGRGTRIDQTPLLASLLDVGSPLLPVLPEATGLANRLLHPEAGPPHPKSSDGTGYALLLDPQGAGDLESHGVDTKALKLLHDGEYAAFLLRRASALQTMIKNHAQSMALWGFADGPDLGDLFDESDFRGDDHAA